MWIEIESVWHCHGSERVTPLAGVWIEITAPGERTRREKSLPLRECGLKYRSRWKLRIGCIVTPLAGVWIEIASVGILSIDCPSLPLRECGLKYGRLIVLTARTLVTPLAGVWIEIGKYPVISICDGRHSPCGSVDWNYLYLLEDVIFQMSLPLRECGLKFLRSLVPSYPAEVTPLAGVWIEME